MLALAEGRDSLAPDDSARAVVDAVAGADGVLIAGGGNLASTWPLHVYERAALAGIAARLGRPLVVSGQTLGPDLRGRDRELVADLLRSAAAASAVRESTSQRLAADLGVDAPARRGRRVVRRHAGAAMPLPAGDGVLVSLSLSLGRAPRDRNRGADRRARGCSRRRGRRSGAIPRPLRTAHPAPAARGDAVLHDEVRARMRGPSTVVPTGDVPGSGIPRPFHRSADHRAVPPCGLRGPAGVPVLGLVTDDYTAVKQRGALAHWGQDATVPISAADTGGIPRLHALWQDRDRIADVAARRLPRHRA